jgi:membrane protease YdiL (CAAX protease family)
MNPYFIGSLAALGFGWGWAKNRTLAKRAFAGTPQAERARHFQQTLSLGHITKTVILGPVFEEWAYRKHLQGALAGLGLHPMAAAALGSVVFGADHGGPKASMKGYDDQMRKIDAALGGLLYSVAFAQGGLLGAAACHGAHNLGCALGWVKGINQAP